MQCQPSTPRPKGRALLRVDLSRAPLPRLQRRGLVRPNGSTERSALRQTFQELPDLVQVLGRNVQKLDSRPMISHDSPK